MERTASIFRIKDESLFYRAVGGSSVPPKLQQISTTPQLHTHIFIQMNKWISQKTVFLSTFLFCKQFITSHTQSSVYVHIAQTVNSFENTDFQVTNLSSILKSSHEQKHNILEYFSP
jgi:hypothetical protein